MASRLELLKEQFFDNDGDVLSGGLLYTYIVGTTTPKATYTTAIGDVEQANPVVLDSSGRIPSDLYGSGAYKIVIKTSAGVTIDTIPDVTGINEYDFTFTATSDYSSDFDAAITAIGATESTLYVDDTAVMSANVTIPSTLAVKVIKGGTIDMGGNTLTVTGKLIFDGGVITHDSTLTVNGLLDAPAYDIGLDPTYTVTFGRGAVHFVYPEWWGALPDGSTDSTDAMDAAHDAAVIESDIIVPVIYGAGEYMAHELDHQGKSMMVGSEVGLTKIIYNGSGGADSYLIGFNVASGWNPWGGYKNITFYGYDIYSGGEIAENIWKTLGDGGIDIFTKFENVHFAYCFGDAIYSDSTTNGIVNWHMNKIRFDGIGGWCINLEIPAAHESRPLSVEEFTLDNTFPTAFGTQAASDGYYDGTHWGKGFFYMSGTGGVIASFKDGRIESNKQWNKETSVVDRVVMFLTDISSGWASISLSNVQGYFDAADAGILVYAGDNRTNFTYNNCPFQRCSSLFENENGDVISYRHFYGFGSYNDSEYSSTDRNYGIRLQGNQLEFYDYTALTGDGHSFNRYRAGDIVFNTDPEAGGSAGWIVTSPEDGVIGEGRYQNALSTTAACTNGSSTVTLSDGDEIFYFSTNLGVILVGAGPAAANLETYITSIDEAAGTFEVNDNPSTSVDPLTIYTSQATFTPFGVINLQGSASWDPGSIANGAEEAKEVTVTGAALGDFALASFSLDVSDLVLDAQVTAADTVTCILANNTGGAIDLGSGTVYVKVIKK